MNSNHHGPIDAIQQAMREIVSLHRVTVQQLGELVHVQRDTTTQLYRVSDAMHELSSLLREMTAAQGRVNEMLGLVTRELERLAQGDEAVRRALQDFVERLQAVPPHLEELTGQLVGFGVLLRLLAREQERAALAHRAAEVHRHAATLFCRYLTRVRVDVPGAFFDEIVAAYPTVPADAWLSAELVVFGYPRSSVQATPLWVLVWMMASPDEAALDEIRERAVLLREQALPVLPAVAVLQCDDESVMLSRGIVLVRERSVIGWDAACTRWSSDRLA